MLQHKYDYTGDVYAVYTDAGILGKGNRSLIGGTYSFVYVGLDVCNEPGSEVDQPMEFELYSGIGTIKPEHTAGLGYVECNLAETIAILMALEGLPVGWKGTLYGDNLNSIRRAIHPRKCKGIVPKWVKDRLIKAAECRDVFFQLVGGHPSDEEVERGYRSDGKIASRWNVRCDKLATQAKEWLTRPMP